MCSSKCLKTSTWCFWSSISSLIVWWESSAKPLFMTITWVKSFQEIIITPLPPVIWGAKCRVHLCILSVPKASSLLLFFHVKLLLFWVVWRLLAEFSSDSRRSTSPMKKHVCDCCCCRCCYNSARMCACETGGVDRQMRRHFPMTHSRGTSCSSIATLSVMEFQSLTTTPTDQTYTKIVFKKFF